MTYLLDSDWLIRFLNGRRDAAELIDSLAAQGLALSVVSCGEALEGLLDLPRSADRLSQFEGFLSTLDVLPVDLEVGHRYASIRRELRRQGQLVPDNDSWIAATALANDLTLVTRDRHFERVPGLKLYQVVR